MEQFGHLAEESQTRSNYISKSPFYEKGREFTAEYNTIARVEFQPIELRDVTKWPIWM